MINYVYQSGKPIYGLRHYVVDTAAEITKLPTNCAIGSTATIIATGENYIMNSQKQWIKQPNNSGSSGSGDNSGGTNEIVVLDNTSPSAADNNKIVVLNEV